LRERYVMNENQERLLKPGLKAASARGVTSIDDIICKPIIDYCERLWGGKPSCPKRQH
jgi:hypothetical protein